MNESRPINRSTALFRRAALGVGILTLGLLAFNRPLPAYAVREAAIDVLAGPLEVEPGEVVHFNYYVPGPHLVGQVLLRDADTGQVLQEMQIQSGGIPGGGCIVYQPGPNNGGQHVVGELTIRVRKDEAPPVAALQLRNPQTQSSTAVQGILIGL